MTAKRKIGLEADYSGDKSATTYTETVNDSVFAIAQLSTGMLTSVGGTANVITGNAPIDDNFAYADGMETQFIAANTNTGAVTLNVSGAGAKALKDNAGLALDPGIIVSGNLITAKYYSSGDHWRLLASGGTQNVTVQGGLTVKRSTVARTLATVASTTSLSSVASKAFQTLYSASRVVITGGIMLKTASGSDDDDGLVIKLYVDGAEEQSFDTMSWSAQAYFVPVDFEYLPGDTSSHTYEIRASSTNAAVYPVNGSMIVCEEWGVNP